MSVKKSVVPRIQTALAEVNIPAWLFYGFRELDPIATQILEFEPSKLSTRRWFYLVPMLGEPKKLVHQVESSILDHLPGGKKIYRSWQDVRSEVQYLLSGFPVVAMQYSDKGALPHVSRVDGGTIDLIRSFNTQVISSGDLIQHLESVWTIAQLEDHRSTAKTLAQIVQYTFRQAVKDILSHGETNEVALQKLILELLGQEKLVTNHFPIVAVNKNSADPHYQVTEKHNSRIQENDFLLIDLWAKTTREDSVYADITWTAFLGSKPPAQIQDVFEIVQRARDQGVSFLHERHANGSLPQGWEIDDAVRAIINAAGYGKYFTHRTGHNLGTDVHGNGVHFDNLETHDTRRVIEGTCYTIEPGIYLEGKFGIRSEINVYISDEGPKVTTPVQDQLIVLPIK